jgi:hypothetical protein
VRSGEYLFAIYAWLEPWQKPYLQSQPCVDLKTVFDDRKIGFGWIEKHNALYKMLKSLKNILKG